MAAITAAISRKIVYSSKQPGKRLYFAGLADTQSEFCPLAQKAACPPTMVMITWMVGISSFGMLNGFADSITMSAYLPGLRLPSIFSWCPAYAPLIVNISSASCTVTTCATCQASGIFVE
jgi:hypothetical protein